MNQKIQKSLDGPVVLVSREISYTFPLSYAYLAGYLREHNEKVEIVYKHSNYKKLVKQIMELDPLLVGFGSLYPELKEIREIIKLLDEGDRRFPVVVGGQMVSPTPEFAVEVTGADFGIIGEGEITLLKLVNKLRDEEDPSQVKGIVYRSGNDIITTGIGDYIADLSKLPKIPFDLFPESEWLHIGRWYAESNITQTHWRYHDKVINVHGGRGCPFKCNFCYHHNKARYRPISDMMEEASESLDRFDANFLYFSDDLVLSTPKRATELVEAIKELKRPINYSVSARIDTLTKMSDALLQEMKETGCRTMGLGIESGSDRILKLMGKRCTSEEIFVTFERLRKVGIVPNGNIMVGQHTETREDVEMSIQLMKEAFKSNPNLSFSFSLTTPFPGSELYKLIMEKGLLNNHRDFYDRYFDKSIDSDWNQVVNLSNMEDKEVIDMFKKINMEYHREKKRHLGRKIKFFNFSKYMLSKTKTVLKRLPKSEKILKIYDPIYSFFHERIENEELRARKIIET